MPSEQTAQTACVILQGDLEFAVDVIDVPAIHVRASHSGKYRWCG